MTPSPTSPTSEGWSVASYDRAVVLAKSGRKLGRAHQASGEDAVAVARMWAASPDLYEALKSARSFANMAAVTDDEEGIASEDQSLLNRLRAQIDAALQKARGDHD